MSYRVTDYEATPNPNALKCWVDRPISDEPRSFLRAEQTAGDPLAAALFAIPGVTTLLFNGDWVTVNKTAEAKWPAVKRGIEGALADADIGSPVQGESS